MTQTPPDRAAVRFPPPFAFVLSILAAIALHRWLLPLSLEALGGVRRWLTYAAFLAGGSLIFSAMILFWRTGQNPEPWKATPEVIFGGPYRVTRNPMYLGMALLQTGAGLGFSNAWLVLLLPAACYAVCLLAIRPEEEYLERKFGDTYRVYKASVRRWL